MKRALTAVLFAGTAACLAFLINGCETTSADAKPEITPSSAVIKIGNSVEFRASGGFDYEWSLQNEALGRLDTRRGTKVVYRSQYDPGSSNSAMQVLSVSSTIQGSSGTSNTEFYVQTAEAYITHIATNQ